MAFQKVAHAKSGQQRPLARTAGPRSKPAARTKVAFRPCEDQPSVNTKDSATTVQGAPTTVSVEADLAHALPLDMQAQLACALPHTLPEDLTTLTTAPKDAVNDALTSITDTLDDLHKGATKNSNRLFTKHDVLRVHAITNVILAGICIPRTLQCVYEMFFHLNTVTPMQYELPLIHIVATLRDISSVPLAYKFRRGNPRMMFLLSTYVDFSAWCVAAMLMPSYSCIPQLPTPVTTGGVIALSLPLFATIAYSMKDPDENVNAVVKNCSPQERKDAENDSKLKKGSISFLYLVAMIFPCLILLQSMLPAIWGGQQYFDYMHAKYHSVEELTYAGMMVGTTCAAFGVFLNTLKDRRVISRGAMDCWQAGLTSMAVLFLARVVASHPDGGVFFTQLASLQFWKPMLWMT